MTECCPSVAAWSCVLKQVSPFGADAEGDLERSYMSEKHRIVIVGGGFAGLYAAIELEKSFATRQNVEITLINKENFFLFTPMLHDRNYS